MTSCERPFQEQEKGRYLQYDKGIRNPLVAAVINAALALGAVSKEEAEAAYMNIMQTLSEKPDLWEGANPKNTSAALGIKDAIEENLPVIIGDRNLYTKQNILDLHHQIHNVVRTHVVIRGQGLPLAIIGSHGGNLTYINGSGEIKEAHPDKEKDLFEVDKDGHIPTISVRLPFRTIEPAEFDAFSPYVPGAVVFAKPPLASQNFAFFKKCV